MRVKKLSEETIKETARLLQDGGIVCFPTDTIYGLLALASRRDTIERLYSIRRPSGRPFLLLIPDATWVSKFDLFANPRHLHLVNLFNATFIFYKKNSIPLYLTRGRKSLALRLPSPKSHVFKLLQLLQEPVVAPSANQEGQKPATDIEEAIDYFGDKVDLYVDDGKREGKPSTIVRVLYPKGLRLVREGSIEFREILKAYRNIESTFSS